MVAEWADLTLPVQAGMDVFSTGDYSDVRPQVTPWCTVADRGFATQRLVLGTQTGTHLDAPAHFVEGGATVDGLPATAGVGRFRLIQHVADLDDAIPLLDTRAPWDVDDLVQRLVDSGVRLLVLLGPAPTIPGEGPWGFNRAVAEAGLFLVEDLAVDAFPEGVSTGQLMVAWPRLVGTSGAPCRVLLLGE